jgi:rare lipoprotein A
MMGASSNLSKRAGWRSEERRPTLAAAAPASRETVRAKRLLVLVIALGLVAAALGYVTTRYGTRATAPTTQPEERSAAEATSGLDRSGRIRIGKASFYAGRFAGRTMADGTPMKPHGDNAASKTLPLGTKALVTNLETGRGATVTIRDRGPYVKGRIVDLSPSTAQKIGIDRKEGVAMVEVKPIEVPSPK